MVRQIVTQLAATLLIGAVMVSNVPAVRGQESGNWELIARPAEGFTIRMPVKPEEQSDRIPFERNTYLMRMYTAPDRHNGMLFMVLMQEISSAGAALETRQRFETFMNGFKEGMAKTLGTEAAPLEMKAEGDLNLKGSFGRQYALSFGNSRGLVRGYDAKNRIYVLVVVGGSAGNESTRRFFDSFAIMPAPVPVPMPITK